MIPKSIQKLIDKHKDAPRFLGIIWHNDGRKWVYFNNILLAPSGSYRSSVNEFKNELSFIKLNPVYEYEYYISPIGKYYL